jgi:hypothetical protein
MSQELEDRFFRFAKNVRDFCLKLKWNTINREYIRQLIRSSGSVGLITLKLRMIWESWMKN